MTTAYIVTGGEYSEYHVVAACSSREVADWFIDRRLGDSILELAVYDTIPDFTPVYNIFESLFEDGSTRSHWEWVGAVLEDELSPSLQVVAYGRPSGRLEVSGPDKQAVEQAFGDRRGRILDALAQGMTLTEACDV